MSSLNVDKLNVSVGIELPSYTAANRPTGTIGLMIFNSDSGTVEIYDGTSWISTGQGGIEASGGITTSGHETCQGIPGLVAPVTLHKSQVNAEWFRDTASPLVVIENPFVRGAINIIDE